MYFQIYDKKTGKTLMTCPTSEDAKNMLDAMDDASLRIRPILKSEHPLAGK